MMRLLTFNIHKGFSSANRRFTLGRMRELIRQSGADVVFLQEVQGAHVHHAQRIADWPSESQFEFLADSVWSHFAYGRNAVYDHGHHGNAILSKWPLMTCENIDISTNRLARRGLLHGVIRPSGSASPVHLLCTHLNLGGRGRAAQVGMLESRLAAAVPPSDPLVLAGDLNDWSFAVGRRLERDLGLVEVHRTVHGLHARSFPAWLPLLHLDRIYVRGLTPTFAECLSGPLWRGLSDHAALVAEVT
jgi:endonuclease/exonuclease/phosphatase family metal-dependent hydrolase